MTYLPRKALLAVVSFLAKIALRRHQMRVLVIVGSYDSDLAKEMIYTVLNEKTNARRNVTEIWWDLSIPLNILGYDDRRRSLPGWIAMIVSAAFVLLKSKPNPHLLILNADSANKHTIDYWSGFLEPSSLVILNQVKSSLLTDKLIMKTVEAKGKIIVPEGLVSQIDLFNKLKSKNIFTFGRNQNNNLIVRMNKESVNVNYKNETITFKKSLWMIYSEAITGSLFSIALLEGIPLNETILASLKFTFPGRIISRIKTNLNLADSTE